MAQMQLHISVMQEGNWNNSDNNSLQIAQVISSLIRGTKNMGLTE